MMDLIARTLGREREARLESARTIQDLLVLGVERAITLWPEWGRAFTVLDKRVENRPMPPPPGLIGKRIAWHNGAHVGGRKGAVAHAEGVAAVFDAARASGWTVGAPFVTDSETVMHAKVKRVELRKDDQRVVMSADGSDIVRSAITFTAVITGYTEPTVAPTMPWQFGSDPADSESWSYAWHIADVVVLATPIECAGIQGFWPLSRLVKERTA